MTGVSDLAPDGPPLLTTLPQPDLALDHVGRLVLAKEKIRLELEKVSKDKIILDEELKLLSRFLYKNHNRFRNDKGYKCLRMVEKSLLRFASSSFEKYVRDVLQFLPSSVSSLGLRLPTSAMCGYALQLSHSAAEQLVAVEVRSRRAAECARQRLGLGHFWGVAAVALAIVARLWLTARHVLLSLTRVFSELTATRPLLPSQQQHLLHLPPSLYHLLPNHLAAECSQLKSSLSTRADPVLVEDFLGIGDVVRNPVKIHENVGEAVKREKPSMELIKTEAISEPVKSNAKIDTALTDSLSDIHGIDEMKAFLKSESLCRKTNKKCSFTRKLTQSEWKEVKRKCLAGLNPSKPNKSVKLCRKLLRTALK